MQIVAKNPGRPDKLLRRYELGENLSVGDPVYLYDDAGTAKVKKVASPFGKRLTLTNKAQYLRNCQVAADTIIVFFRKYGSYDGWVVAVDVSDPENPVEGTPVQVSTSSTYYLDVVNIAAGKFVCLYNVSSRGNARVGTVSGTTITLGTASIYSVGNAYYSYGCRIVDDQFCVVFRDSGASNYGQARIASVSGTTITWGTVATYYAATAGYAVCIYAVSPNYIMVAYRGAGSDLYVIRSDITGNNFVGFTGNTLMNAGSYYYIFDIKEVSGNKFIICARNGSYQDVTLFTKLGYTLTHQETVQLSTSLGYYASLTIVDNSWMFVIYTKESMPYEGQYKTCYVPGVNFDALSDPTRFSSSRVADLDVCTNISGTNWQAVLCWVEYGTYNAYLQTVDSSMDSFNLCLGVLEESGSTGETKRVALLGSVSEALSGYVAGERLYIQPDASVGSTETEDPIAVALDAQRALLGKTLISSV
jgi:hypothetical protein